MTKFQKIVASLLVLMVLTVPAITFAAISAPGVDGSGAGDTGARGIVISGNSTGGGCGGGDLKAVICVAIDILKSVTYLVFAVALVYFLWGVAMYVGEAGEASKQAEGRAKMIWGIVGLFVMVAVWGLVGLIQNTFSLKNNPPPDLPQFPTVR